MAWIVAFIGFVLGASLFGSAGQGLGSSLVVGLLTGVVGFLIGRVGALSRRVSELSRKLESLPVPRSNIPEEPGYQQETVREDAKLRATEDSASDNNTNDDTLTLGDHSTAPAPPQPPVTVTKVADPVWNWLVRYFTEGNLIARVGILILLFGVAFLIRYAAERTYIPDGLKLLAIALAGGALMAVGWVLRNRKEAYGLALQGGGLGVVYLAVYSGVHVYAVLSPVAGLGLLVLLVAAGCLISLSQNALVLAGLSLAGGFLAPILTSTGEGNHIVLLSYYLLLNVGIAVLAWYKAWRPLNLLGFAFTFFFSALWAVSSYHSGYYLSSQLFLIAFFALYVVISVLFALRQPPRLRGLLDGLLVFGVPVVALFIQSALMEERAWNLGWATAFFAAFYGTLALLLHARGPAALSTLVPGFFLIAAVAGILTIPFALGAYWTASLWSILAVALLWAGKRHYHQEMLTGAFLLLAGAGLHMLYALDTGVPAPGLFLINRDVMGSLLLAAAALVAARMILEDPFSRLVSHRQLALMMCLFGLFWLSIALLRIVLVYTGMNWSLAGITGSVVAQTSLSIAWTVFGLVAAVYAAKGGHREVWLVGAGLIGLVVVKLFLVDLAGTGTLARVVSFLSVGGLLLLVGYVAPMPRRPTDDPY